ncbi:MAG: cation transporter [Planctomycetes bacterium]|nr:cation transporter [Planctomycetota bacterium]
MHNAQIEIANKHIRRVTYLSVAVNLLLAVLKIAVGFIAHSMSLVADGIHSFSDLVTDAAVLLGVYIGSKEADDEHPYGHGRFETFATIFIAAVLIVVGGIMIQRAGVSIGKSMGGEGVICQANILVLLAAGLSVLCKEGLYWITKSAAVRWHSTTLYANAWHHRSDSLSSVAVILGFVSLKLGYAYGDQVATIAVGLLIILVGIRVLSKCIEELSEGAVDSATVEQIRTIVGSETRIRQWHKLRTRNVGREVFLDMHILVDPALNIRQAHEIAESLETALHEQIPRPVNITVHIEPDEPELRK